MKTNLLPNGHIDQKAALAAWNFYNHIDFRTWGNAKKLTSYRSLQDRYAPYGTVCVRVLGRHVSRETDNRQRLRVLTAEADKADKADKARKQQ